MGGGGERHQLSFPPVCVLLVLEDDTALLREATLQGWWAAGLNLSSSAWKPGGKPQRPCWTKSLGMYFLMQRLQKALMKAAVGDLRVEVLEVATLKEEQNLEGCRKNGVPCLSEAIKAGLEKVEGRRETGQQGRAQARTGAASEQGLASPDPALHGALPATGAATP